MKLFLSLVLFSTYFVNAQVGVGTVVPNASLDVVAKYPSGTINPIEVDGLLIPRVTRERAQSMTGITISTIIYVTEVATGSATLTTINVTSTGFYFFNGAIWDRVSSSASTNWTTTGNSGLSGTTNFLGTTDGVDVTFRRANIWAGKIETSNTSFGLGAGSNNGSTSNTAFGVNALTNSTNPSSSNNVAIGWGAMDNLGSNNTAQCVAIGVNAFGSATTNSNSVAIGFNALQGTTTGIENTAVGSGALNDNGGGSQNTAVGRSALFSATGSNNVGVGYDAGRNIGTGSSNTCIGYQTAATSFSNATSIGYQASSNASNQITLGNGAISTLRCNVTSITALSDRRDKTNIKKLSEGIDFIKKLKPVSYTWNTRDKLYVGVKASGFIAQDLLDLQNNSSIGENLDLVDDENPERFEARYSNLLPVIISGMQEQQELIEQLQKANEELMKTNAAIIKRLEKLEN